MQPYRFAPNTWQYRLCLSGDKGFGAKMITRDARDVYGKPRALGEVDYPNAITLRTSAIVGLEMTWLW